MNNKSKFIEGVRWFMFIGVICIFIWILFVASIKSCSGEELPKYGYLVYTTGAKQTNCKKVLKVETAQKIFDYHFPRTCVDINYQLSFSNLYQIITENRGIYIEKKRIKKRRNNGKLVFRKIKRNGNT